MTRDDERHDVPRDDVRHRPHRPRFSDLLRQPGVTANFALRNACERLQHIALQRRSFLERDCRFVHPFALDRGDHLAAQRFRNRGALQRAAVTPRVLGA